MLKFIKSLFKQKPVETKKLTLDSLKSFFDEQKSLVYNDLDKDILNFYSLLRIELKTITESIPKLKDAGLRKDDLTLPDKVKNIVKSHKDHYLNRLNLFIEKIQVPSDSKNTEEFLTDLNKELDDFSVQTLKSYKATSHLYFDYTEPIFKSLKNIHSLISTLQNNFKLKHIDEIKELEQNIGLLIEKINLKKSLSKELSLLNNSKNALISEENKLQKDLLALSSSKENKELNRLLTEKISLNSQLSSMEQTILNLFSVLERALRKYSKISIDNIKEIDLYLKAPVVALINDNDKSYLGIFSGLKSNLTKLDLGDKKEQKTLDLINEILDSDSLDKLRDNYDSVMQKIVQIDKQITSNTISLEISKLKSKIDSLIQEIKNIDNSILNNEKSLSQIDLENIKKLIQENFLNAFGISIVIV